MSVRTTYIIYVMIFCCLSLRGETHYGFRVYLKDKGATNSLLENPEQFLSKAALERRKKNKISIQESDLPISSHYLDSLVALQVEPLVKSRWFSTVVVSAKDSCIVDQLSQLSIVDSVKWVWKGKKEPAYPDKKNPVERLYPGEPQLTQSYGYATGQIKMLNGIPLHESGFTGKGMSVAVIDAGFKNVDRIGIFDSLDLAGTYNVLSPGQSVFEDDDHGTKVLSCLAANTPGIMVGTAPDASYWLIKSEDSRTEYPIEEDYWTAAVEFADSAGVDVISSSLGYFHFDVQELNYPQDALDGRTALITRAADMAAQKGILIFSSAGNEGGGNWEKITFPGDAGPILTVGAITGEKKKSVFSSTGFTADYRVKPDIVALGSGCTVVDYTGNIRYANGTSFSTPIVAGLGVCLWQALPHLSNQQIIELIREVSNQSKRPDAELGYGIPDIYKAYKKGRKYVSGR